MNNWLNILDNSPDTINQLKNHGKILQRKRV